MTTLFISLLNMSVTAAITALAVMLARAVFKKLPKWLTCALWAAVGLRLLLPFSVESAMSLIPRASTVRETVGQFAAAGTASSAPVSGGTEYFIVSNFIPPTPVSVPSAKPFDWLGLLTWVWVAGVIAMLGYMLISALLLKRRVGASVETEPGVFVADGLASPFVLGVFRPNIYLPSALSPAQKEMILAHEKAHLKRRDHLIKPFAFLLLSVYWFNPVLWIAYALLCRDIELACDERVIRDMDRDEKAFYSQTLLDCGRQHRRISACPVAFGEVGVKERVKNVLNYKKPAFWIILVAVIAGIVLAVCFLTDPKSDLNTGVRINVTYLEGENQTYEIRKNGELKEIPFFAPTDLTVYHSAEGCFSTIPQGDVTNNILQKTELLDKNGQPVVLTDDHRAIFDAVIQNFGENISPVLQMDIYESHNGDDRYFISVNYANNPYSDTYHTSFTDILLFHPSTGELDLLATVGDCTVNAVYTAADINEEPDEGSTEIVQDAGINSRIFAALKEQHSGSYLQGEYYAEAHHIYGTEEQDGKTVVYALVRECWFGFINGYFTDVGGGQYPAVFTFDGDECKIEQAKDGSLFENSVKELFPAKYANQILKHGERYNDRLWNDLTDQAKAYLKSIGRNAAVCPTYEAGLSTLSDHGVSAEVSNKLTEDPRFDQYPFYGTEEHIENGVRYVYSTDYDAQTGQITYLKYIFGEDPDAPTQKIMIDAATGETLFTYSAPVGPVEQGKTAHTDIDWIEAAKIDERVCDVDGDGVQDRCVMSYGPTSGLFTFIFTVTPEGATQPKYQNIFLTDHATLSFPVVKSDPTMLYVQAVNPMGSQEISNYVVLIEDGNIVLRGEGGDMEYLGEDGGKITLRRMQLSEQYPELFTLNAEKGLDVYVWPWGVTDGTDREPAYRCWLTESTAEQRDNWKEYRVIPDGKNGLSALSPEDMKVILAFYDIPAKKITVIPYQHPLSSYLWAQDGKIIDGSVTVEDLREMFGL